MWRLFFTGVFNWSFEIPGYKIHHHAILAIYLATYFGIFGLFFSFFANRLRTIYGLPVRAVYLGLP